MDRDIACAQSLRALTDFTVARGTFEESQESFEGLRLITQASEFELYVDAEPLSRPRVVLLASLDTPGSRARLSRVADAHRRVTERGQSSSIPPVHSTGVQEGRPYVAFVCAALCDFGRFLLNLPPRTRIPYSQAIVFIDNLMQTCAAANLAGESFGALSLSNVLVDARGRLYLVGLGDNVLALDDAGLPRKLPDVYAAPEVAAGAKAAAGSDMCALSLLCRRLMPYVEFPPNLERVFQGRPEPEEYELAQLYLWCNLAVLASYPDRRPSWNEALEKERRAWELAGIVPDQAGFWELLRAYAAAPHPEIVVDDALTYVAVGGKNRTPLGSRRALRRILGALVERHRQSPEGALTGEELVRAGWPGEILLADAAANRVYVALSALRKLGLDSLIERCDGGWRLSPNTAIRVVRA